MELNALTFTPLDKGWDWISVGFGCIAFLGLVVLLYQLRAKRKSSASEISSIPIMLLVTFATMLASGALIYSLISTNQIETVEISDKQIRTPFGTCEIAQIQDVYIYPKPLIDTFPQISEKESFLIILEYGGFQHSLSSKSYDIQPIYYELKKVVK